jgi:hypothetical protein
MLLKIACAAIIGLSNAESLVHGHFISKAQFFGRSSARKSTYHGARIGT